MKARCLHSISMVMMLGFFVFLSCAASSAVAADNAASSKAVPGTIADTWVMWPKAGQAKAFEAALKQHAAWRKNAGEGFIWSIYQPIVGEDLTFYVIRSGEHQWKDFDANTAWETKAKSGDTFDQQVGPYLERVEHYFSETDTDHSHWIDDKDYRYFSVTSFATKSGTHADRTDALNKIQKAVIEEKWPYPYEISNGVGGREPLMIVIPMKTYADMADPNPSIMKVLSKSLGSDAAATAVMRQFGSSVEQARTTIYQYRPDLSTPK